MVGAGSDCFGFSSDLGAHQVPLLKILVWKVEFARLLRDLVIAGVFCSIVVRVGCCIVAALCVGSAWK